MLDIASLGTILTIWAHPDDETWAAAGIMASAVDNGQKVACVTATRGELGVTDAKRWPPSQLGQIREKELAGALHALGVTEHYMLDYHDGECAKIAENEAVDQLVPIIEACQPDTVLTFDPTGMTGHPDHQTVSHWSKLALAKCELTKPVKLYYTAISQEWYERIGRDMDKQFDIYFAIDKPILTPEAKLDICFRPTGALLDRKMDALRAHASQSSALFARTKSAQLRDTMSCEAFMLAGVFPASTEN